MAVLQCIDMTSVISEISVHEHSLTYLLRDTKRGNEVMIISESITDKNH